MYAGYIFFYFIFERADLGSFDDHDTVQVEYLEIIVIQYFLHLAQQTASSRCL